METMLWSTEYAVPNVGEEIQNNIDENNKKRYVVINRKWLLSEDGTPTVLLYLSPLL